MEVSLLITGCAHNGIINILTFSNCGADRYYVIGSFHLSSRSGGGRTKYN